MTMSFDSAFNASVAAPNSSEGGFVVSILANDSGGQTCAGIARNYHPDWPGWALIDAGVIPSDQRIVDAVRLFYMTEFWNPLSAENMPPRIAAQVFDFAINAGVTPAIKAMQRAIGVHDDGIIGATTIGAIRLVNIALFVARFNAQRIRYYVGDEKDWPHFGRGWMNRVANQLEQSPT